MCRTDAFEEVEEATGRQAEAIEDLEVDAEPGVEDQEAEDEETEEEGEIAVDPEVEKKRPVRRGKKQIPPIEVGVNFEGDTTLLLAVHQGAKAIEKASMGWVGKYHKNKVNATAEAATFVLQACGIVAMSLSGDDIEHHGSDELKTKAEEVAKDKGLENILTGRGGKIMKENYKEMWDKMIRQLGKSHNNNVNMFVVEKIVDLTIALSTSMIREIRKMATITVAQVSTSLLFLAAQAHEARESASSQANAEEAKGRKRGNRAESFKAQAEKASSLLQEFLSFVDSIFQSVFTTRFRDIDAEIRSVIVQNLGSWMLLYPSTFLSSTYLKYLAWALSDKDGSVRYAAVNAIHRVYQDERNAIQLKDFTNRFSDRMTELMEDKDDYVAVAGTELVTMLIHDNHLGSECGRNVFNLLSDPSERLRSAAAELAAGMIKKVGKDLMSGSKVSIGEKKGVKRNQKRNPNAHEHELAGVLSILQSLAEAGGHPGSRLPEKIVYFVVSSLLHKLNCLTNWHLISDWLQADVPSSLFGEAAVHDLAMLLLCAAKTSVSPSEGKSQVSKERKNAQSTARQELTLLLQKDLQSLIRKYQSDPFMISIFVRLVPMMKLELYSLKRQEPAFVKLLNLISEAMFKHSDAECVKACSMSLAWCTVEGKSNTKDIASSAFVNAVQEASSGLEKAIDVMNRLGSDAVGSMTAAYNRSDGLEESEEMYKIRSSVMYVSSLLEAQPSALDEDEESHNRLRTILRLASEGWELPSKTVFDAEKSLLFILISRVSDIKEDQVNNVILSSIKDTVSDMFTIVHAIIYTAMSEGWKSVAATSAAVLADLITIFSEKSLPLHLKDLSYLPLDEDIDAFWNGIEKAILDTKLLAPLDAQNTLVPAAIDIVHRICCSSGIRQFKQLGAKLLSYWEHPALPAEVSGSFKDLIKKIRGMDSTCLPDLYLHAMRHCYNRYCQEVQDFPHETRDEMAEKAIEPFLLLSHKIANSQAGLNAPFSTISYIAEKAALWSLEETPRNLEFLQGASYFVVKVKGPEASIILTKLEAAGQTAAAPPDNGGDMGDWELFYEYCDVLRSQSQKQKNPGVLKKSTPKSTAKPSRRISFAMDDDFEANVQVSSGERRRSSRFESTRSPNYKETLKDDVDIMDSDIVSPSQ